MHNLWGMRPSRRVLTGLLSGAAISCGASGIALADHPGAVWSVSLVEVEIDQSMDGQIDRDAVIASVRSGLRRANEIYFYGDVPVRMKVAVHGSGAPVADIVISDGLSGAVLARARGLSLDGDALTDRALAWLDGLDCAKGGCVTETATAVAAVERPSSAPTENDATVQKPSTQFSTVTASTRDPSRPTRSADETDQDAVLTAAIPVPRPQTLAVSRVADLVGTSIGRTVGTLKDSSLVHVRLASFDTAGFDNITYSDVDVMVLGDPVPQPGERPISSSRRSNPTQDVTVFGQMFDSLVSLISLGEAPQRFSAAETEQPRLSASARISSTPRTSDVGTRVGGKRLSVRESIAGADAPFRPNARWAQVPVPGDEPSFAKGEQVAALSIFVPGVTPSVSRSADATVGDPSQQAKKETLSPVFRGTQEDRNAPSAVELSAQQSVAPGTDLSIRLHPEVFGRFSVERYASLVPEIQRRRTIVTEQPARPEVSARAPDAIKTLPLTQAPLIAQTPPVAETLPAEETRVASRSQVADRQRRQIQPQSSAEARIVPEIARQPDTSPNAPATSLSKSVEDALEDALAERGLALDQGTYSQNFRVSWDGSDRSERFVVTLPQIVGFKYAVVASSQRNLVARVESVPGPVRLSGAVATTLGLRENEWMDIQVVALREIDRLASRASVGQVFTSARIALPLD